MEKQQLLRDPNIFPTEEIIAQGLGNANSAFVKFTNELSKFDITLMEWRYYNDGMAWLSKGEYKWSTPRGAKKVKPIFWFSIWEGFFRVTFFFAENIRNELLNLQISENAKDIIKNTTPMGKTMRFLPIIFDINNEALLDDVYEVIKFKKIK